MIHIDHLIWLDFVIMIKLNLLLVPLNLYLIFNVWFPLLVEIRFSPELGWYSLLIPVYLSISAFVFILRIFANVIEYGRPVIGGPDPYRS